MDIQGDADTANAANAVNIANAANADNALNTDNAPHPDSNPVDRGHNSNEYHISESSNRVRVFYIFQLKPTLFFWITHFLVDTVKVKRLTNLKQIL